MATVLNKPVTREIPRPDGKRAWIVTLKPGGMIAVREKGRRAAYEVPIGAVWWMGAKRRAEENIQDRKEKKRARKVNRGLLHL